MTDNPSITIEYFFEETRRYLEKKIKEIIKDKNILKILESGKRLRPVISYLSFKTCTRGEETPEMHDRSIEGGVAIELAHTASLVHDDIIDGDKVRRGRPAFHITEGIPKALLIGHRMLSIGFHIALSHGDRIAKLYVDTWDEVLTGEIKEVDYNTSPITEDNGDSLSSKSKMFKEYYRIINMKTASLFYAACKAGAIEADAKGEIIDILGEYGREIGLAYQLADDLVDLENGEMIESVIIPLLTRLENRAVDSSSLRLQAIRRKLAKHSEEIKNLYIEEIKRHLHRAEELSRSDIIPTSLYKELLQRAPSYIINSMLKEVNITV